MGGDPLAHPDALIRRVYSYVAYRVGDGAEAEDLTSDTFECALRYRATYDSRKGTPQAWLLGIARTCIAEHFTNRVSGSGDASERPSDQNVERETVGRLTIRDAVARLGDRDQELIALRYGADLRVRDIAEPLGERTNTIEVAPHRALERLRQDLADEPAPDQATTQPL